VSRLVVDPERFADDSLEPMADRGMGVIYTKTAHGDVLRDEPDASSRAALLNEYYNPHHTKLLTFASPLPRWRQRPCLVAVS
jgi:N-formylglutamate deformylase